MIKIYVDGTTLEFSVLENNFDETFRKMGLKEIHWIRRNQSHQWNIVQQVFLLSLGITLKLVALYDKKIPFFWNGKYIVEMQCNICNREASTTPTRTSDSFLMEATGWNPGFEQCKIALVKLREKRNTKSNHTTRHFIQDWKIDDKLTSYSWENRHLDNTTPHSHSLLNAPKLSVKTWSDDINLLVGLKQDILVSLIRWSLTDIEGLNCMCTGVTKRAVTSTRYPTRGNSWRSSTSLWMMLARSQYEFKTDID